jgi:glutamate-5-semialdehyde dehydrogenase
MMTGTQVRQSTSEQLVRARAAAAKLAQFPTAKKNAMLLSMADALERGSDDILAANDRDLQASELTGSMRDRLCLDVRRVKEIAEAVRRVADLQDPLEEKLSEWSRPNGLLIRPVRVPLGVIGVIYESRPNVTVDAAALALKAGNAVALRGGKEARHSNRKLVEIMNSVPEITDGAIELLDSSSRDSVKELITARGSIDVVIPRGSAELISFVVENASVPVIETGAGNCHIFVDAGADLAMADRIIINAKTQRPSVCNAAEKLLVHAAIADEYVPRIVQSLIARGVQVRGDEATCKICRDVCPAETEDWDKEFLSLRIAVAIVPDVNAAIEHVNLHSTKHSDCIITADEAAAKRFLSYVDSAVVYWNASTRFSDGAEFGFGAEMGISTQKLHCRGPFALRELTSLKYQVVGNGQIRP